MKQNLIRVIGAAGLALALGGHAQAEERRLQVKQGLCIELTEAKGRSVIELAEASISCFAEGKLELGLEIYVAASVREEYDVERMEEYYDTFAIDGWVSREIEDIIGDDLGLDSTVVPKAEQLFEDPRWVRQQCENVTKLGLPRYWPDYLEGVGEAPVIIPIHPLLWLETVSSTICEA